MLFAYRTIINFIALISPIIIFFRLLKKKEDPKRFKEKFCIFSKKRMKGNLIWFHGASVGEILSVIPLIEKLEKKKEIKQILITSNTLSSSKIIANLKLKKTIHQFFPIDTNYHSQKFLKYWQPSSAIFIDSEIWPNMIVNIKKRPIKLILLNGRITKKSFNRWKVFNLTAKKLFQKFDICLASNNETKKYLEFFEAKRIKYIGNLKFSQIENEANKLNHKIRKYLKLKTTWCAASTHDTEELLCATIHKELKNKYKNLLTIIIPRHVERKKKIISQLKILNLKIYIHSSGKKIPNNTDIYLVDSYGKTKSFFKICKTVFLGGSMIEHGGQNPIEAARYGCKILHGKNTWNFKEVYSLLNRYNVTDKINNLNQMKNCLENIIDNKNTSKNTKDKIDKLGDKILKMTLKEIKPFII